MGLERAPSIVLEDVGAKFAAAWNDATPEIEYGPENVTAASDAVASANPLRTGLPAVRDGRIVRTDKFTDDGGPLTALWTLDLVEKLYTSS